MVNIKFIRTAACPVCGCETVAEESIETDRTASNLLREHCNGSRWEHRKFACGFHTAYIPNYGQEQTLSKCAFDPEEEKRRKQQADAKKAVMDSITAADCPAAYKDRLRQAISYL